MNLEEIYDKELQEKSNVQKIHFTNSDRLLHCKT